MALGYFVGHRAGDRVPRKPPIATKGQPKPGQQNPSSPPPASAPEPGPATPSAPVVIGRISIVIDDLGRSTAEVDRLLALGAPLGYAVLPWEKRTAEVVARLDAARAGSGRIEILCHLPMEASGGENPGPNALLERLPLARLSALTREALDALPSAVGVNNHMGSRLTADPVAMGAVLDVVAERGLFLLDSRTTAGTVAFDLARERSIPAERRDVFLDEDPSAAAVDAEFDRLLSIAREKGAAIAIGHPHEVTLAMLERRIPEARAAGFEFVPPSFLVERSENLP